MTRISFVCTGNICRSPMGEVVLRHFAAQAGWDVVVSSAGTANWDVGQPMDPRSMRALRRAGFADVEPTVAQYASPEYVGAQDIIVVMTREHRSDILSRRRRGDDPTVLVRSLAGESHELDLADPYYGDDEEFDRCLEVIIRACQELVREHHLGDATSAT